MFGLEHHPTTAGHFCFLTSCDYWSSQKPGMLEGREPLCALRWLQRSTPGTVFCQRTCGSSFINLAPWTVVLLYDRSLRTDFTDRSHANNVNWSCPVRLTDAGFDRLQEYNIGMPKGGSCWCSLFFDIFCRFVCLMKNLDTRIWICKMHVWKSLDNHSQPIRPPRPGNVYFLFISVVMYLGETTDLYVGTIRAFSTLGLLVSRSCVSVGHLQWFRSKIFLRAPSNWGEFCTMICPWYFFAWYVQREYVLDQLICSWYSSKRYFDCRFPSPVLKFWRPVTCSNRTRL